MHFCCAEDGNREVTTVHGYQFLSLVINASEVTVILLTCDNLIHLYVIQLVREISKVFGFFHYCDKQLIVVSIITPQTVRHYSSPKKIPC